jgi:tRNA(fMet)-specific endonuclease VapC
MKSYMLDTDAVSHFLRGEGRVADRLLATDRTRVSISAIVVQELELGVARKRSTRLRRALDVFYEAVPVVPYDEGAARKYGELARALLSRGAPIGLEDTMIAAHALSLGCSVVTHNVKHFRRVPELSVVDWY